MALLLCVCFTILLYGQDNKGKYRVDCNVMYTELEKLENMEPKGVSKNIITGITKYLYALKSADLYLIAGSDTLDRAKSDFEGAAIFKKVADGEYTVSAVKKGFKSVSSKCTINGGNGRVDLIFGTEL